MPTYANIQEFLNHGNLTEVAEEHDRNLPTNSQLQLYSSPTFRAFGRNLAGRQAKSPAEAEAWLLTLLLEQAGGPLDVLLLAVFCLSLITGLSFAGFL